MKALLWVKLKKLSCLVVISTSIIVLVFAGQAFALSQNDLNSLLNNTPFYDPTDSQTCGGSTSDSSQLIGADNEQKVYNFFISKGLSNIQAAAVAGNLMDESHFSPIIMQKGGSSNNPADADPLGWGLAQWTPGSKIIAIAQGLGITTPIYELATQLNIVWAEMQGTSPTGYSDVAKGLEQENDLASAVLFFQVNFEDGVAGARLPDAQLVFNQYGNSSGNSGSQASTTNDCSASASVNCNSTDQSTSGLSQVRQNIVCIAEQQLALWKSKPGYPTPAYSENGYLDYSQGRVEEWCADFATWVYNQAGDPLHYPSGTSNWNIAYVPNIQTAGSNDPGFTWHPYGSGYVPQPGDLAIHGSSHVNIFISSSGGTSEYIGGDQGSGPYPGGSNVSIDDEPGYYSGSGDYQIIGYVAPN